MVNKAMVGLTGPRFEVAIETGQDPGVRPRHPARRMPAYLDDPQPAIPPTFLTTVVLLAAARGG